MKFTEANVTGFAAPAGKASATAFDTQLTGLGLKATANGARIFIFQYWNGVASRRLTIGRHGEITLADARRIATQLRGAVAGGRDPAAERQERIKAEREKLDQAKKIAEKDALTLDVLLGQWEAVALRDRSARYKAEATRAIRYTCAALRQRPAAGISVADVQELLDRTAVSHPTMARRVHAYLRTMFGWAARRGLVPSNPCAGAVVEGRDVSRERVLTDAEIGEVWRAAGQLSPTAGAFVRLLLLTLQRRNEVAGMRWSELTPDLSIWTIPAARAKNRRSHVVHLAPTARAILRKLPRVADVDLVFASSVKGKDGEALAMSGFSDLMSRLQAAIGRERSGADVAKKAGSNRVEAIADWTFHDFRRTGVTVLAGAGIAPHVADRLLNHVEGSIRGVAAVYQRSEFMPERKAALEVWAAHVLKVSVARRPRCQTLPKRTLALATHDRLEQG
jgi:integrase